MLSSGQDLTAATDHYLRCCSADRLSTTTRLVSAVISIISKVRRPGYLLQPLAKGSDMDEFYRQHGRMVQHDRPARTRPVSALLNISPAWSTWQPAGGERDFNVYGGCEGRPTRHRPGALWPRPVQNPVP